MATRIVLLGGQETAVTDTEAEAEAEAVRRDYPNPVTLEGTDGLVLHINRAHVALIAPQPGPRLPT